MFASLAIALGGALLLGAGGLDLGGVGAAMAGADPLLLVAAAALYALGQTLSGAMWAACHEAGGVRGMSLPTTLGLHWVARGACEVMPAGLGEAVRVGAVRRHTAGRLAGTPRIVGALAGYKALDALVTGGAVLAIALAMPMPGPAAHLRALAVVALAVAAGGVVGWRLISRRRRADGRVPGRIGRALGAAGSGAGVLGGGVQTRRAAVLAAVALVARILSLGALLAAFGAPVAAAGLVFCAVVLSGVIPGAPGGAGAREAVLIPTLVGAYAVPAGQALALSIAIQAVALVTSLAMAAVCLAAMALARRGAPAVAPEPATAPAAA
ncbi:MAG: lysylphosphatidylglycerol synthase domain-containing protein [Miltoncostaeaceae bacterium]